MTSKYFENILKEIFKSIETGLNDISKYDREKVLPNYDQQQLSQYFGNKIEAALRGELNERGIKCIAGNPKDKNEDDILILKNRLFDMELKFTHRKYTKKFHKISAPGWWTDRGGFNSRLRNFICMEGEYKNGVFKFLKIYISFQQFSYIDITTHIITEDFIKRNSFLLNV